MVGWFTQCDSCCSHGVSLSHARKSYHVNRPNKIGVSFIFTEWICFRIQASSTAWRWYRYSEHGHESIVGKGNKLWLMANQGLQFQFWRHGSYNSHGHENYQGTYWQVWRDWLNERLSACLTVWLSDCPTYPLNDWQSVWLRPGSYVAFLPCQIQLNKLNLAEVQRLNWLSDFCRMFD